MIRLKDSVTLARTKLRTRKIRTGIAVSVSGLLFSGLVAALIIMQGISTSVSSFSEEGLGKRYIISAQRVYGDYADYSRNGEVINRAIAIQKERVVQKKAEAKRLGLEYDASQEVQPYDEFGSEKYLNVTHPASKQAIEEYKKAQPRKSLEQEVREVFGSHNPSHYFHSQSLIAQEGTLSTMKGGKEKFLTPTERRDQLQNYNPANSDGVQSMALMDDSLAQPFLLNDIDKTDDKAIPIVVPYKEAEKLLGLAPLDKSATLKEQLDRLQVIRNQAGAIRFSACYRSSASVATLDTVYQTKQEIAKNAQNKDYKAPELITELPSEDSCGAVVTVSDKRTAAQKDKDTKQQAFKLMFGEVGPIVQEKVDFRVVGLSPNSPDVLTNTAPSAAEQYVTSILSSHLTGEYIVPRAMFEALPKYEHYKTIFTTLATTDPTIGISRTYLEFNSPQEARSALKDQACLSSIVGCSESSLTVMPFGSGAIVLEQIKGILVRFFMIAIGIVTLIAFFIMMSTIGRMLADGRRETAVFRAIGAKRSDISLIYGVYTILLSWRVVIFAFILGVLIAAVVDYLWWKDVTLAAQLNFGASDVTRQFHFFSLASIELLYVIGAILLTGMLSMLIPLLRNLRRSPIKDMRDEA